MTSGSDRLRDGFYYFSPVGTPFYPGLHNLGSRDWVSAERPLWNDPPLGEYSGPTKWYRGDPPAVLPLPVLVGDASCIEKGEQAGKAIQLHKSARCTDMLPRACYLDAEILAQKTKADNCLWALQCILFIYEAYTSTATAIVRARQYFGLSPTMVPFEFAGALSPAGIIIIVDDICIVCITGTTTDEQGWAQALAFGFGPQFFGDYSASPVYEAAALLVMTQLAAVPGVAACTRFICTGHSYGGAAAIVLAAKLKLVDSNRQVEILTFGAPKAGGSSLRELTRPFKQLHYVHEGDPVPYLPPDGSDFFNVLSLIPDGLRGEWGRYVRPGHVFQITDAGTFDLIESENIPNDAVLAISLALAAHDDIPRYDAHKAGTYAAKLAAACPCVPGPVNQFKVTFTNWRPQFGPPLLDPNPVYFLFDYQGQLATWQHVSDVVDAGIYVENFDDLEDWVLFVDDPLLDGGGRPNSAFVLPPLWWLGCTLTEPIAKFGSVTTLSYIDEIKIEPAELV